MNKGLDLYLVIDHINFSFPLTWSNVNQLKMFVIKEKSLPTLPTPPTVLIFNKLILKKSRFE